MIKPRPSHIVNGRFAEHPKVIARSVNLMTDDVLFTNRLLFWHSLHSSLTSSVFTRSPVFAGGDVDGPA